MKHLKFILLVALFFWLQSSLTAQEIKETKNVKHELNFGVTNLFQYNQPLWWYWDYYDEDIFYYYFNYYFFPTNPSIGLGYKLHSKQHAWRLGVSGNFNHHNFKYDDGDYPYPDTQDDSYKGEFNNFNISVSTGYEKHSDLGDVQIFYGFDLFFNANTLKDEMYPSINYPGDPYINEETKHEDKYITIGYGISPLIGVKYFITDNLSLSTEIKILIEYYKTEATDLRIFENDMRYTDKYYTNGVNTRLGSLGGISVNIYF